MKFKNYSRLLKKKNRIFLFLGIFFYRKEFILKGKKKHGKEKGFNGETWRHDKPFCSWLWQE